MKIKEGFVLRHVMDEHIVVPKGPKLKTFPASIMLNDVSAFLWENLESATTAEALLEKVLAEYEVDSARAAADIDQFIGFLRENALLDE